jgi:outer membrane immunogenic protein
MKKLVVALTALAAFTGSALAADMAPRPYTKAPAPVAAVTNWTGCYIGGGGGYGMWNQENTGYIDAPPAAVRTQLTQTFTNGGRGYFGTVQGGCDYQFSNFVVGLFGDYDFADISGQRNHVLAGSIGTEKLSSQWAVGGRAGWLVFPSLLTYFSAGYTEAKFDPTVLFVGVPAIQSGTYFAGTTYKGYFIGAGDEYALSFLPGLFWKTEYRVSRFDTQTQPVLFNNTVIRTGESYDARKWEQTIRSELVYRFNWGGAVVAKY